MTDSLLSASALSEGDMPFGLMIENFHLVGVSPIKSNNSLVDAWLACRWLRPSIRDGGPLDTITSSNCWQGQFDGWNAEELVGQSPRAAA